MSEDEEEGRGSRGPDIDAGDVAEGCCCIADLSFDPSCYIATAAHGDFEAPEVRDLRRYRDERLVTSREGRLFAHLYYRLGRYPAGVIRRWPALKPVSRAMLRPAVWWARRQIR